MTPEELEELRALVGRLNCTAYDENLAALLEELNWVDVKTYDDIEVSRRPTEEFAWYDLDTDESIHVSFGEAVGRIARDSPQYQDIIQGSIQRACERRGWTLTLEYVSWYVPARRWHAYISSGPRGCDTKDTAADSAAEALLAAYIAAVRAGQ